MTESNIKKNQIVAIVGMSGAGKTEAASVFISHGWQLIRFGQIILDEVQKRGLEVCEANERSIREEMRAKHGMGAFAVLNQQKIESLFKQNSVIIDGLYSWSEYKILKEKYGTMFKLLAIYASPKTRYERLENRGERHGEDSEKKFRSIPRGESEARDKAELESLEKGGPISMADKTIINEDTLEELYKKINEFINKTQRDKP